MPTIGYPHSSSSVPRRLVHFWNYLLLSALFTPDATDCCPCLSLSSPQQTSASPQRIDSHAQRRWRSRLGRTGGTMSYWVMSVLLVGLNCQHLGSGRGSCQIYFLRLLILTVLRFLSELCLGYQRRSSRSCNSQGLGCPDSSSTRAMPSWNFSFHSLLLFLGDLAHSSHLLCIIELIRGFWTCSRLQLLSWPFRGFYSAIAISTCWFFLVRSLIFPIPWISSLYAELNDWACRPRPVQVIANSTLLFLVAFEFWSETEEKLEWLRCSLAVVIPYCNLPVQSCAPAFWDYS